MKKLLQALLTFKFIVSFLALLALLLVWVIGDRLGLPTRDSCFIASIVVFSIWVLLLLIGHLVGRAARQTWKGWAEQRAQEASAAPVTQEDPTFAQLRARLLAAIHTLKTSSLGRRWLPFGGRAVYRMPWVVLIGAGGAGRTALMKGSDLEFPLLQFSPYEENRDTGYDGCEWNFADQAVVLDTNGRLAESVEGRPEWRNLLTLLKKHRSKKPLDALVLAVDVASLATADDDTLEKLAKQVRDRVQDLADQIGFQVPVYIAFTQIDRIEGFDAFFRGANAKELQRPWGAMLSWRQRAKVSAAQAFNTEFDLLASELREMAEQRLLQQRGVAERLGLYSFPIEFAKLKPTLAAFVGRLFQTNPYQFRPLFRGFYFTSVTQGGGALISPAGTQIRSAYGIFDGGDRQAASVAQPRRYFVDEFFRSLVLPDRGLALHLPWRLEVWQKWVLSLSLVTTLLLAGALALSWNNNRLAEQAASEHMADLSESLRSSKDPRAWLLKLDALRADAQILDSHVPLKPFWWRFGLYHGDSIRVSAREAYFGQFQQQMLNPMGQWLEAKLSTLDLPAPGARDATGQATASALGQARAAAQGGAVSALAKGKMPSLRGSVGAAFASGASSLKSSSAQTDDPGDTDAVEEGYTLFKVYNGLADPSHAEAGLLTKRLPGIWRQAVSGQLGRDKNLSAEEQAALERCLAYYVAQLKAADVARYDAHQSVLGSARDTLKNLVTELSPVKRLYKSIVEQEGVSFPAISLAGVVGEAGQDLMHSNMQIQGMYTRQAWEKFFKPAFEEASKKELVSENLFGDDAAAPASPGSAPAAPGTGTDTAASTASSEQTFDELKRLYIEDYAQHWRQFLASIEVTPFASLDSAVAGLGRLGDLRTSPYVALVQTLDEQTSWDAPTKPVFEEIAAQAQTLKDKVLGKEPEKQRVQRGEQVIGRGRLELQFMPLTGLVHGADKGGQVSQSLARYLEQLQGVRSRLAKIRTSSAQGGGAVLLVKNTLEGTGSELNDAFVWTDQLLSGMDANTQDAVRKLFMQPILGAWNTVLAPAAIEINGAWASAVIEPWNQAFTGRYPFVDSTTDASLLELSKFVRDKDGLIWVFMRQNFDFLVTRQNNQLIPRQWAGKGLNIRPDFLETLNRLARVGEAIGLHGDVSFKFYLQPEPNPRIAQTELELDGQALKYQNGPADWKLISWPGPSTAPQVRVQAVVQDPAHDTGAVQVAQYQRGPWAWMRALAAAQVERLDGSIARLSWPTASGQTVSYLMRNEASYGPQDLALIYGLKLPTQILQVLPVATADVPVATPTPTPTPPASSAGRPGKSVALAPAQRDADAQARQVALQQINQRLAQPAAQ